MKTEQPATHFGSAISADGAGFIFVDDGSPEASDYDSNYIGYDPAEPESYRRAVAEAGRVLAAIVKTPFFRRGLRKCERRNREKERSRER